jgi:hypothetical protein
VTDTLHWPIWVGIDGRPFLGGFCLHQTTNSALLAAPYATPLSMLLVKQSASMALLFSQRCRQFSSSLSLMRRHSKVVRCSEHDGVEVLVAISYTDLQPTIKFYWDRTSRSPGFSSMSS